MRAAIASLWISLIIQFILFIWISRKVKTYFNYFTLNIAHSVIIQSVPFILGLMNGTIGTTLYSEIITLSIIQIVSQLALTIGYSIGYRSKYKNGRGFICFNKLDVNVSKSKLGLFTYISIFGAILSFVLLALKSGGLYNWIFHNRTAYIQYRAGNGVYYILFELFLIVGFVIALTRIIKNKKGYLSLIILFVLSYFTGSKGFVISAALIVLFFYDHYVKRIKFTHIVIFVCLGLIALSILLFIQSGLNLFEYVSGDFYSNFLLLVNARRTGDLPYYYGKLTFEDTFWKLIPRSVYPDKPYVYGQSFIVSLFYGEETVIAGNTPSFSEYAVTYADGGILFIIIKSIVISMIFGYLEKQLKCTIKYHGLTLPALTLYTLFFILAPVNFGFIFKIIFIILFVILLRLFKTTRIPVPSYGHKKNRCAISSNANSSKVRITRKRVLVRK